MGKFTKDNWFKMGVLLSMLIVSFSVVYYFVFLTPKIKEEEMLSENQAQCLEAEGRTLDTYKKQNDPRKQKEISSSHHYNLKLKKCFVEISDSIVSNYHPTSGEAQAQSSLLNSVLIFEAVEDKFLGSCLYQTSLESPPVFSPTSACLDTDGYTIPKSKFDSLEKEYMTE